MIARGKPKTQNTWAISISNVSCEVTVFTGMYTRRGGGSRGLEDRCGLGGKVNTNPGNQNARFKGSKIRASRTIRNGEEIFVPYRKSYKFKQDDVGEERFGWEMFGGRFYRDMG